MGVLSAGGLTNAPQPSESEPEESQAEESQAEPAPAPETFVPFAKVDPPSRPPSRRQQETERVVEDKFKSLFAQERQSYDQRIQEMQQELARTRGQLEAVQRMPQPTPQAPAAGPSPDALFQEAESALEKGDVRAYHAKIREANEVIADRKAEIRTQAMREEFAAKIPPQLPPEIQFLVNKHQNVALAGQRGFRAVQIKDQELDLYGVPPGPQRIQRAFELADKFLASQNGGGQQAADPSVASALSAVPAARPSGGGAREEGVRLTALQAETAKAAGMSPEEYVKWSQPERFIKR